MTGTAAAVASGLALWPGLLLAAGGFAKARDVWDDRVRPTAMSRLLPGRIGSRPATGLLAGVELAVGILVLAGLLVPWPEAAAALLLAVATLVVVWALRHAPDADCGCFGGSAAARVSVRSAIRAALLAAFGAVAAVGGESWTSVFDEPAALVAVGAGGAVLVWLSLPELREWWPHFVLDTKTRAGWAGIRLERRRLAACEQRSVPVDASLERLRDSELWARVHEHIAAEQPIEHWDEGCSRFICYPADFDGEPATAVFSVYLGRRQRASSVAFVDEAEQRVLARFEADQRSANSAGRR